MRTLYLLPYSFDIRYSFDKSILEELVGNVKCLACHHILEVNIDEKLAESLKEELPLSDPYPLKIPSSFYEKEEKFLKNPPDWFKKDGMRIYIIFNKNKECCWCPSGNNLNSFYEKRPEDYLSKAIRVELNEYSYIQLNAYFNYRCDRF